MRSALHRRFVFLDRDGTLVQDCGFVHRVADYRLLPGVIEGLQRLRDAGFAFAIVTNQSGIGRGRFTATDFESFQRHLVTDLARHGIVIERSFHCPHRPDEGCGCRKPAPGLLWRARDELGAALERSWLVGDAETDVLAARSAGCAGAVQLRDDGGEGSAQDLRQAASLILAASPRA